MSTVSKSRSPKPPKPSKPKPDPYRYGWRYVPVKAPDGTETCRKASLHHALQVEKMLRIARNGPETSQVPSSLLDSQTSLMAPSSSIA
jgi:hypothetical protein